MGENLISVLKWITATSRLFNLENGSFQCLRVLSRLVQTEVLHKTIHALWSGQLVKLELKQELSLSRMHQSLKED